MCWRSSGFTVTLAHTYIEEGPPSTSAFFSHRSRNSCTSLVLVFVGPGGAVVVVVAVADAAADAVVGGKHPVPHQTSWSRAYLQRHATLLTVCVLSSSSQPSRMQGRVGREARVDDDERDLRCVIHHKRDDERRRGQGTKRTRGRILVLVIGLTLPVRSLCDRQNGTAHTAANWSKFQICFQHHFEVYYSGVFAGYVG